MAVIKLVINLVIISDFMLEICIQRPINAPNKLCPIQSVTNFVLDNELCI